MNEIMEKTYELIDLLENSDLIKELECAKRRILGNEQIQKLLFEGNHTEDEYFFREIKMKLYSYEEYKNYMECYNKLRYIVMDINNRYQRMVSDKTCFNR